jgi:hypothetical protein
MTLRLVTWFRRRARAIDADAFASAVRGLCGRATELGGRVVLWERDSVAFDFSPERASDAAELAVRAGLLHGIGVGIAAGELETLDSDGVRFALGVGPVLSRAEQLARLARSAEILVDPELAATHTQELPTTAAREGRVGSERVRGLKIDRRRLGVVSHPPVSQATASDATVAPPQAGAQRAPSAPPPGNRPASIRPGALVDLDGEGELPIAVHAVQALKDKNPALLDELVMGLRAQGEHLLLADRLEAMANLVRGETGEALRVLRAARERAQSSGSSERSRAALALAVGLAAARRKADALLEALDGLARAREAGDVRGERACARFLAQLSRSAGDERAAEKWATLAV